MMGIPKQYSIEATVDKTYRDQVEKTKIKVLNVFRRGPARHPIEAATNEMPEEWTATLTERDWRTIHFVLERYLELTKGEI